MITEPRIKIKPPGETTSLENHLHCGVMAKVIRPLRVG
jgi:hypothetical protein